MERKVARGRVCGDPGGKNWVAVVVGEGSWPVFFFVFRKMSVNINVDGVSSADFVICICDCSCR